MVAEAEAKRAEHQEQIKRLKEKDDEYQKVQSNISKNNELLEEYYKYKEFLDRVYQPPAENTDENEDQNQPNKKLAPNQQEVNKQDNLLTK